MKKVIAIGGALCLVAAFSLPAMADVDVLATINKTKIKTVTETVQIFKDHYIGVKQVVKPSSSAEAQAVKNDVNQANTITENGTPAVPPIPGIPAVTHTNTTTGEVIIDVPAVPGVPGVPGVPATRTAIIDGGALDGAAGIINVNQSPGSLNNQGNADSIALSLQPAFPITVIPPGTEGEVRFIGGAFLHAEASAQEINGGVPDFGNNVTSTLATRSNTIDGALNGATGLISVNQAAGHINNQNNATALSVGDAIASLSEADLGMVNSYNYSQETGVRLADTLTNSALNGAAGIINVNQSSGSMNNQANIVAAAIVTSPF